MKKRTFKKHMNRCEDLFSKWKPLLLPGFKVRVRYHWTRATFEADAGGGVSDADMWVRPSWDYMTGHVHVCVPDIRYLSDKDLEESVVHELVHIMLHEAVGNPTDADRRAHEERVVTMTARALLRARDGEA